MALVSLTNDDLVEMRITAGADREGLLTALDELRELIQDLKDRD
jgi:hypothetical protein